MSPPLASHRYALSLTVLGRIDEACVRFEDLWKGGQRPLLEEFLQGTEEPERSALLRELLALELEYRRRVGAMPTPEEFQARFPGHEHLLRDLFQVFREATTVSYHSEGERTSPPRPTPTDDAEAGFVVGNYHLLERLGRGGMGVVYKAWQTNLKRIVALKRIRAGTQARPDELARFRNEAEAVAQLQHPNLIQIYEIGEHQGLPYFVMEFAGGGNLGRKVDGQPQPPLEAAQWVATLAQAMHAAHQRRIVHRDLKPANILLTADGTLKIADFGLAKLLDRESGLTWTGQVFGTPGYMSPEQAEGRSKEIGPLSDVYSLGVLLYELLTGRLPFQGGITGLSQEPVPPTRLRPEVPRELEIICMECLAREPNERYPSAEALAEDLRRFEAGEPPRFPKAMVELDWHQKWAKRAGFEILEAMECTSLNITYQARQLGLNRVVLLRLFSGRAYLDPAKELRFRTEVEALAQLDHPHIAQVHGYSEQNGWAYCSMEWPKGHELARNLQGERMPLRKIAELGETLAKAIHFVHGEGILHCNLSPFSIRLTTQGSPKIMGFHYCKLLGKKPEDYEWDQIFLGSSSYQAPEQAESWTKEASPATDVYSLGAILYALITGQEPLDLQRSRLERIKQIRSEKPKLPRDLRPEIPPELEVICLNCLEKEPQRRYPSAALLAENLRRFLAQGLLPGE
ncbi:MAG: serine/threonine protein kinase [Planctomycetes bacterium]|nr:serine/threonine protein kinase [Planctomycetota bacterium]